MTYWQASECIRRWKQGENTYDIAVSLSLREAHVEGLIFDRVVRKSLPGVPTLQCVRPVQAGAK